MMELLKEDNIIQSKSSFRDPSGFIFYYQGALYRQINKSYKANYDSLMTSGLFDYLAKEKLIIPHQEVSLKGNKDGNYYKIIKPAEIPFISYPYEWCFSQLKDAALITLKIQKIALQFGMSLKDSSAYNIQFYNGKPILIDTLSFERYREGKPWVAYRQFCQHFLGPLALMSYKDHSLGQLFRIFLDGPPLSLLNNLLPLRALLNFSLLTHIYLQAKSQNKLAKISPQNLSRRQMSKQSLMILTESLGSATKKIPAPKAKTLWQNYYSFTNYSETAFEDKKKIISDFLAQIKPKMVWDMGANTGLFSRLSSERGIKTIAFDLDYAAVEQNYQEGKKREEENILPLLLDLTNPSPSLGWAGRERLSLLERGPAETVMALALIHHLTIANNVPFGYAAQFFSQIGKSLIIEFVPKSDEQTQKLLITREDIFPRYTKESFEQNFKKYFQIKEAKTIKNSERIIYLMTRKPV